MIKLQLQKVSEDFDFSSVNHLVKCKMGIKKLLNKRVKDINNHGYTTAFILDISRGSWWAKDFLLNSYEIFIDYA